MSFISQQALNKRNWNLALGDTGLTTDPLFGNVILLLNGDGALTTDYSPLAWALTATATLTFGPPTLFGQQTYLFDEPGVIERLSFTSGSAASFIAPFGSQEWCFETFFRPSGLAGATVPFSTIGPFQMGYDNSNQRFQCSCTNIGSSSVTLNGGPAGSQPVGSWYHVAFVRDNTTDASQRLLRLFVNGTQVNSNNTQSKTVTVGTSPTTPNIFGPGLNFPRGNASQYRVTLGNARYYTNFTPPSAPFPTSGA